MAVRALAAAQHFDLGRQVARRADKRLRHRAHVGADHFREPEIEQPDGVGRFGQDEDVLGLDVAVHDGFLVQVGDRARDLRDDRLRLGLRERRPAQNQVEELRAFDELHHEAKHVRALVHLVELDDVGVGKPPHDLDFASQTRRAERLAQAERPQVDRFRRKLRAALAVDDPRHDRERALADLFPLLVVLSETLLGCRDGRHARVHDSAGAHAVTIVLARDSCEDDSCTICAAPRRLIFE